MQSLLSSLPVVEIPDSMFFEVKTREYPMRSGNKTNECMYTRTGEAAMEQHNQNQEATEMLPLLGWLLLSEEERRLLQAYVLLALSSQTE